jgi:CheY-like chemotaxis protein/anti-sigma regulatory factor (Ser/Thr protein kinase)
VSVDAARLKQILINLLGNAVKFTHHGRVVLRVRADARRPGNVICFEVEDSGIGIPEHEIAQVFEAFHQVESGNDVPGAGSGLGLSIAQQICRAMGGELTCESRVGVGSVFRFDLKLMPTSSGAASSEDNTGNQESATPVAFDLSDMAALSDGEPALSGMVLLVDDNPVNVIVAQAELSQLGLHVEVAHNGQQALDWLAANTADLILMDCHMPEMDGYTATRCIRQMEAQQGLSPVPIVALTASTQDEELLKCRESGMDDYLCKPFASEDMKRMLHKHLPIHAA